MPASDFSAISNDFTVETNYRVLGRLIERLAIFVSQEGETRDTALLHAHILRRRGEWLAAAKWLEKAILKYPTDVDMWYEGALNYIDAGYYANGVELLTNLTPYITQISEGHLRGIWRAGAIAGAYGLAQEAFQEAMRRSSAFATRHVGERIDAAVETSKSLDFNLVSIGENCLPWMMGNRWGLRSSPWDEASQWVFNLGQTGTDHCTGIIADRCRNFLCGDDLVSRATVHGTPFVSNARFGFDFNHELGEEWIKTDFEKLRLKYNPMIRNTLKFSHGRKRVFFHYTERGGNLDALISAVSKFNVDENYRIVIVDVSKFDKQKFYGSGSCAYLKISLPREGYIWFKPDDFDSPEGVEFERQIRDFVLRSAA